MVYISQRPLESGLSSPPSKKGSTTTPWGQMGSFCGGELIHTQLAVSDVFLWTPHPKTPNSLPGTAPPQPKTPSKKLHLVEEQSSNPSLILLIRLPLAVAQGLLARHLLQKGGAIHHGDEVLQLRHLKGSVQSKSREVERSSRVESSSRVEWSTEASCASSRRRGFLSCHNLHRPNPSGLPSMGGSKRIKVPETGPPVHPVFPHRFSIWVPDIPAPNSPPLPSSRPRAITCPRVRPRQHIRVSRLAQGGPVVFEGEGLGHGQRFGNAGGFHQGVVELLLMSDTATAVRAREMAVR